VTLPSRVIAAVADRHALVSRPMPFPLSGFSLFQVWHERARKDAAHAWLRQLIVSIAREV
jgi:DNA-binding transcriptional LysR family regulator